MLGGTGLAILSLETAVLALGLYALCRWSPWWAIVAIPLAFGWIALRLPDLAYRWDMGVEDLGRAPFIPEYIASFVPLLCLLIALFRKRRGRI